VNNTIVSNFGRGLFLNVFGAAKTVVLNNIFSGSGVVPPSFPAGTPNLISANPLFQDAVRFDYRLKRGSAAIDAGLTPGTAAGFDLTPQFEYVHPMGHQKRNSKGPMDIGAYEYVD
jgi:hypothetical protein